MTCAALATELHASARETAGPGGQQGQRLARDACRCSGGRPLRFRWPESGEHVRRIRSRSLGAHAFEVYLLHVPLHTAVPRLSGSYTYKPKINPKTNIKNPNAVSFLHTDSEQHNTRPSHSSSSNHGIPSKPPPFCAPLSRCKETSPLIFSKYLLLLNTILFRRI